MNYVQPLSWCEAGFPREGNMLCRVLSLRGGTDGKVPSKIRLTYFPIEGAAEKVRLAFKIGGISFHDHRIERETWPTMKPSTPYGQLPLLTLDDGLPIAQSGAMLRYAGKISGLYPDDAELAMKVDEVIGLSEDLQIQMTPSMYINMKPEMYGHPADLSDSDRKSKQAFMRAALQGPDGALTRFLGYFEELLEKTGSGFFVGEKPTIADCQVFAQVRSIVSGRLDGIPKSILNGYPRLSGFMVKMMDIPAVREHYS
eukprot:CAMPEP_0181292902 /NCGR_PEP_ID=MMETSP1101-20121128/2767_1 /TAXON_ID=46948 /ORGANISM="Rhodomonas abbreviata, Strain Caron Lab Isolate" /LENGTH=255 /DNA_ID=CAMNT_0023397429 /DNA_START=86 /DNA_END=853 /DNA_ORIENTATION=-